MSRKYPYKNQDEWFARSSTVVDSNSSWIRIGEWAWPTKDNTYERRFYHLCKKAYLQAQQGVSISLDQMIEERCFLCNEEAPDGIKMIALLELL